MTREKVREYLRGLTTGEKKIFFEVSAEMLSPFYSESGQVSNAMKGYLGENKNDNASEISPLMRTYLRTKTKI